MRMTILRVLLLVGVGVLVLLLFFSRPSGHRLALKSYFKDAVGLRAGAPVRIAGVDVGYVSGVHVQPEMKEAPVEVIMVMAPSYDLKVPNDSTAMLGTAGVLGETYLAIDTVGAFGPPAGANTVLKSRPTVEPNTEQMIQKLGEFMQKKNCDCDCKKNTAHLGKLSPRIPRTESPGAPGLGG